MKLEAFDYTELGQFELDPAAADLLPEDYCRQHHVVLLGVIPKNSKEPIHLGQLLPRDADLAREVAQRIGREVLPVQLNDLEIRRAIDFVYGTTRSGDAAGDLSLDAARRIEFDPDQSAAKMLDDLLSEAVRRGSSDVHIEVYHGDIDLRFRIDGILRQITTPLNSENIARVTSRIKVLANLDLIERRKPQDGRLRALYADGGRKRRLQIRVAVIPGLFGEEVVLRILDPAAFVFDLAHVGMSESMLNEYDRIIRYPYGLILVSGPTCSGKSSTLYCTLERINTPENKILSVEDPVEYDIAKASQKNVTEEMGFADYVRAFLRQNPDVLLIGEIRDEETAVQCVRAANTGHMVFSSIHTGDAISAVSRIRAFGVHDDFLSEVLVGVLAQRLVRKLCLKCRKPETPDPEIARLFFDRLPDHAFFAPGGCDACDRTGYRGRTGIFELFHVVDDVRPLIARGANVNEIKSAARALGFRTMAEDALDKVRAGITSLAEVARVVNPRFG